MLDKETVTLNLDERNELLFKIVVQGASTQPSRVRLVCEDHEMSYMFRGEALDNDEVRFVVPSLKNNLKEGQVLNGRVEVLIENRYFAPVEFNVLFKQNIKVVSEGFRVMSSKQPEVAVTAKMVSKPVVEVPKPTIQEQVAKKKNVTGLNDKAMEEVARSSVRRLLGK